MGLLANRSVAGVLCLSAVVWRLAASSAEATTYYVATDGSDANLGTSLETPFRTLQRAAAAAEAGDVCYLRGGVYRETLAPLHSGSRDAPITFAAYQHEAVTLSGADSVSGWKQVSAGLYTATTLGSLGNGFNQVWVDGALAHQARHPNFGGGDLLHPATFAVSVGGNDGTVITSSAFGGRPNDFWAGSWFNGAIGEHWSWQCARVMSSSGDSITVDAATKSNPWFTGNGVGLVWGLLSLLDAENEWYLQTPAGGSNKLFLRVAAGGNPANHVVEMKRRNWCVDLNGRNHIIVSGLILRGGAARIHGIGNILESCQLKFSSHFMRYAWGYAYDGGIASGAAVVIDGTDNTVRGCTLCETAGSGIISHGAHNEITRNLIFNTDYSGTYACSVRLDGIQDLVSLNTLAHSGRDLIQPGGAGHNLSFNEMYGPGQMCRDVGAVYVWGVNGQSADGARTRLAYNWIHDQGAAGAAPLVYLDNWCRNFDVDHNVCWNSSGDAGIRVNAPAAGHRIYNNTLFNCDDVATHTYNMWPANNPDPAFWTGNRYGYAALNNLFLGAAPQTQLSDWAGHDFRLKSNAAAMNTGVALGVFPDNFKMVGMPDKGAYESGGIMWKAGVDGWSQPTLTARPAAPGQVTLTSGAGAAFFQLYAATNPGRSAVWVPVTNLPAVTVTQWSVTLPVNEQGRRFFRLKTR